MLKNLRRLVVCASNDESFVKYNECLYVFNDAIVRKKFIKKYHDDSLSENFDIQKILNLISK